jgi:hypothetical protein
MCLLCEVTGGVAECPAFPAHADATYIADQMNVTNNR